MPEGAATRQGRPQGLIYTQRGAGFFPVPALTPCEQRACRSAGGDLAAGYLKCAFSIRLPVFVGYKVFEVDHDHNGHVHGMRLSGAVVGMTYRF